jgi:hypothetical protein
MKPISLILIFIILVISPFYSQTRITYEGKMILAKYTHPIHDLKDQLAAPPYFYKLSDYTFQVRQHVFLIRKLKEKSWGEPRSYIQFVFHEDRKLSSRTDVLKNKNLEIIKYDKNVFAFLIQKNKKTKKMTTFFALIIT